ncbi:MAG: OmpA family protein [Rhodospirillales bacterium]|nr:OmpA family protein [Rhodospirillales bacterium]
MTALYMQEKRMYLISTCKRLVLVYTVVLVAFASAASENPGEGLVFFDKNKTIVTPEARKIVEDVARIALRNPEYRVEITGHDDAVLPEVQSLILSQERAGETARLLVEYGVPADRILVGGVGSKDPLVATPKGVSEPMNRYVGINFVPIAEKKTNNYLQPFK